jgi:hypothetical protein
VSPTVGRWFCSCTGPVLNSQCDIGRRFADGCILSMAIYAGSRLVVVMVMHVQQQHNERIEGYNLHTFIITCTQHTCSTPSRVSQQCSPHPGGVSRVVNRIHRVGCPHSHPPKLQLTRELRPRGRGFGVTEAHAVPHTTRVRCVSIFLDKNRRYIGKSQSQRPPKRTHLLERLT